MKILFIIAFLAICAVAVGFAFVALAARIVQDLWGE